MSQGNSSRTSNGSVHVIAPVGNSAEVLDRIASDETEILRVIDLSAGELRTAGGLRSEWEMRTVSRSEGSLEWSDGADFAPAVGDRSREAYVSWLTEMANVPLAGGKSIKELFTYNREVALWWLTGMSEQHHFYHPYRWLFYMIFVIRKASEEHRHTFTHWHFWVSDEATGRVLRAALPDAVQKSTHVVSEESPEAPKPSQRSFSPFKKISAVWRWYRSLAQTAEHLSHHSSSHANTPNSVHTAPSEDRAKPLVLFHTTFPHSWVELTQRERFHEKIVCLDRYFGDAPWRLEEEGFKVGWLPVVDSDDTEEWGRFKTRQDLPDVEELMRVHPKTFRKLIRQACKWVISFIWYFGIKRIDRKWCFGDIPLGHWLRLDFAYLCSGGAMEQIFRIEKVRAAVEATEPSAVLYRDELYRTGRHVAVAGAGKTELIGVQHAILDREHTTYQVPARDRSFAERGPRPDFVHNLPLPGRFIVFGDHTVTQLRSWGTYPEDQLAAIGGLRFDGMVERWESIGSPKSPSIEALREDIGLRPECPVVLLCTGLERTAAPWIESTIDAIRLARVTAQIAVKLHQYHGGPSVVFDVARRKDFRSLVVFEDSLQILIRLADVVVAGPSTVVLESRIAGTPCVVFEAIEGYPVYPFGAHGLADPVANTRDLAAALSAALGGGLVPGKAPEISWPERLGTHLNNLDHAACERLASLLRNLDRR